MNAWPDDLWQQERYLTRATLDRYANDADGVTMDSLSIIESIGPLVALGVLLTSSFCAGTALGAVTAGWRHTRKTLKPKVIG